MQISILASQRSPHQLSHQQALLKGLKAIGIEGKIGGASKHMACWGWRLGKEWRKHGSDVLVMERGYIGDRFRYTSLGWNGLNNHAEFPSYPDDGGERFRRHGGIIKPWKEGGDYILILGQVPGDASLQGRNMTPWYAEVAKAAEQRFGKPVYFRPHPKQALQGATSAPMLKQMNGSLEEALSGALFSIAFNSNSCLDSVLAGVPCYAGDKGTMAWNLCMHDLGQIQYPDREKVVHSIAWTQWEMAEIESGEAVGRLVGMKNG